jgi:hypothetical protein
MRALRKRATAWGVRGFWGALKSDMVPGIFGHGAVNKLKVAG